MLTDVFHIVSLRTFPGFFRLWQIAHGGYDRSTEDAHFSMAPDPTAIFGEVRIRSAPVE